jgi:hypothetical protein
LLKNSTHYKRQANPKTCKPTPQNHPRRSPLKQHCPLASQTLGFAHPARTDKVQFWWRMTGSNRRPPACKAGALPAELIPRDRLMVGLVGFEPTTPALSRRCSNRLSYRPHDLVLSSVATVFTADKRGRLRLSEFSRKEVIQPHLPIRLPCYDFTPVTNPAVVIALLAVRLTTSGGTRSHGVTGGVYKTRERIHRGKLIRDY